MTVSEVVLHQALDVARRFIAAFNERDEETLRQLVADEAEFRKLDGDALHGQGALRALLAAAEDLDLRLVPLRTGTVEEQPGGVVRVSVPLRELVGPDDIERIAEFEIRDGRITAFAVRPYV
jgi:ketosteroid isomerase-like protein